MSAFEQLHPSVQHHVVNTLGWKSLRPHQEQAVEPILSGAHVLVQAPTAGGKTEAALLPVLSRMLGEEWTGTSVLYLCPIKALLNDLEHRIAHLTRLFGRRVAVWHGDVNTSARKRILKDPPDIILATPESVEVMLVSRMVDERRLFSGLRTVIVDEVHAFAGDDRGWHLIALLDRVSLLAGGTLQRVALSATLANPHELLRWLIAGRDEPHQVVAGAAPPHTEADVTVDYVGTLANAAVVISRLHAGEKRLVFCDSRMQVEALASELRALKVDTFVSHSSLSRDERLRAEKAFAEGSNCVIVATSTLELGIDVGDLDRVIQIDAPFTVASFLQRLGRSGRRAGTRRNCLFLATSDDALLRAAAVVSLWQEGFVEPIQPPLLPYHVLAQQILALILQEGGVVRADIPDWLPGFPSTAGIPDAVVGELVDHMLATDILFEDGGVLGIGLEGEKRYGAKNFLEIFSVFMSPPLFDVYHGRREIGRVHEESFRRGLKTPGMLSLGGRGWRVNHVDWNARMAFVEPTDEPGKSKWIGSGQPMGFELCQAIKRVLTGTISSERYSTRAAERMAAIRDEFPWIDREATSLVFNGTGASQWWTFAGDRYDVLAADQLREGGMQATPDSLSVTIAHRSREAIQQAVGELRTRIPEITEVGTGPEVSARLKFSDCLSLDALQRMASARLLPRTGIDRIARQEVRTVVFQPP